MPKRLIIDGRLNAAQGARRFRTVLSRRAKKRSTTKLCRGTTKFPLTPCDSHSIIPAMLKMLGAYAIAKLLGFGIVGAIVIYLLLTMVS